MLIMLNQKEKVAFHKDVGTDGQALDPQGRETYLKRFLPIPRDAASRQQPARTPSKPSKNKLPRKKPIRTAVKTEVYYIVYVIIHTFFGIYLRLRTAYSAIIDRVLAILYYHHRTPELIQKDIRGLDRVPQHLSVILTLTTEGDKNSGLEKLLNEVGEISAWCASAGIPALSIYERTGKKVPT